MGKNAQKSSQAPAVEPVANGEGERLLSGQTEKIWQGREQSGSDSQIFQKEARKFRSHETTIED